VPVPADYDGDGLADVAVWNPISGEWKYQPSAESDGQPKVVRILGNYGDIPVPADYDGDGKAEPAIFRPILDKWIIAAGIGEKSIDFGNTASRFALSADFDGDGKADPALYGKGIWAYFSSQSGVIEKFVFGFSNDVPVVSDYDGDGTADFATCRDGNWYLYLSGSPALKILDFGRGGDLPLSSFSAKAPRD